MTAASQNSVEGAKPMSRRTDGHDTNANSLKDRRYRYGFRQKHLPGETTYILDRFAREREDRSHKPLPPLIQSPFLVRRSATPDAPPMCDTAPPKHPHAQGMSLHRHHHSGPPGDDDEWIDGLFLNDRDDGGFIPLPLPPLIQCPIFGGCPPSPPTLVTSPTTPNAHELPFDPSSLPSWLSSSPSASSSSSAGPSHSPFLDVPQIHVQEVDPGVNREQWLNDYPSESHVLEQPSTFKSKNVRQGLFPGWTEQQDDHGPLDLWDLVKPVRPSTSTLSAPASPRSPFLGLPGLELDELDFDTDDDAGWYPGRQILPSIQQLREVEPPPPSMFDATTPGLLLDLGDPQPQDPQVPPIATYILSHPLVPEQLKSEARGLEKMKERANQAERRARVTEKTAQGVLERERQRKVKGAKAVDNIVQINPELDEEVVVPPQSALHIAAAARKSAKQWKDRAKEVDVILQLGGEAALKPAFTPVGSHALAISPPPSTSIDFSTSPPVLTARMRTHLGMEPRRACEVDEVKENGMHRLVAKILLRRHEGATTRFQPEISNAIPTLAKPRRSALLRSPSTPPINHLGFNFRNENELAAFQQRHAFLRNSPLARTSWPAAADNNVGPSSPVPLPLDVDSSHARPSHHTEHTLTPSRSNSLDSTCSTETVCSDDAGWDSDGETECEWEDEEGWEGTSRSARAPGENGFKDDRSLDLEEHSVGWGKGAPDDEVGALWDDEDDEEGMAHLGFGALKTPLRLGYGGELIGGEEPGGRSGLGLLPAL